MMQHDHALDSTLNVELVVTVRWLNLQLTPRCGLNSSGLRLRLNSHGL